MSKRSQESSSPGSCRLVSRQCVSVGDKIIRVTLKARGVLETLTCGPGKKEMKKKTDGTLFSMPRETESTLEESYRTSKISSDTTKTRKYVNSEKMHISIWTRFMASSMQAALHMGPSYEKNLWNYSKNLNFWASKGLFGITRMMIEGNSEIKNVFPADVASSL